jgi:hypothetical protein
MCLTTKPGTGGSVAVVTNSVQTFERTHIRQGGSTSEKLPSRQDVATSKMAQGEGAPKLPSKQDVGPDGRKMAPYELLFGQEVTPYVGAAFPASPDPTAAPMLIMIGAPFVGPPSKESPGRFLKPPVSTTSTAAQMVTRMGCHSCH